MLLNRKDNQTMIVAYGRVSTGVQDTENQMYGVKKFAEFKELSIDQEICEVVKSVSETRDIYTLVEELQLGDTLLVSELSRMGRSLVDLVNITEQLLKKGVKIFLVKEMIELHEDSPAGKLQIQLFGAFAEYERAMIRQRTKESVAQRRAAGEHVGRPKGAANKESKLNPFKDEILKKINKGMVKINIAKIYNVSRMTLNKQLKIWADEV